MRKIRLTVALAVIAASFQLYASTPVISSYYGVVTAPTSTNNIRSLQNMFDYATAGGRLGYISTNIHSDPGALYVTYGVFRASSIIFGPAGFKIWDAVPASGNFANENGQRFAWIGDIRDATPFCATDYGFAGRSSDQANSLGFSGNVGLDMSKGTPLAFSSTLRGELWDSQGNLVASYYRGESITNKVNRVLFMVRQGYWCTTMDEVASAINYFKNHMSVNGKPLSYSFAVFRLSDGFGRTNAVTSQCSMRIYPPQAGLVKTSVEGQRRIPGLWYDVQARPDWKSNYWHTVATGLQDGSDYTNAPGEKWFDRGVERFSLALASVDVPAQKLSASPENGPE